VEVTFSAEAVTSPLDGQDPGVASVQLYPGSEQNRIYQVHVVPPPDSLFESAFNLSVAVALGRRVALTGIAVSAAHEAVAGAPVEASASSALRLTVDSDEVDAILDQLQFPTATTDEMGGFLVWVDRLLVGEAAEYDVDVSPPFLSGAPSWTFEGISVPAEGDAIDLGELELPEASYARGTIRDRRGDPVVGAELRLYQLPAADYCTEVLDIDSDCQPPAHLRGIWATDAAGAVIVVLPDP
jgi:hypothetical protein